MIEKRFNKRKRAPINRVLKRKLAQPQVRGMQAVRELSRIPKGQKQCVDITFPIGIVDCLESTIFRTPLPFPGLGLGRQSGSRNGRSVSRTSHGGHSQSARRKYNRFSARLIAAKGIRGLQRRAQPRSGCAALTLLSQTPCRNFRRGAEVDRLKEFRRLATAKPGLQSLWSELDDIAIGGCRAGYHVVHAAIR